MKEHMMEAYLGMLGSCMAPSTMTSSDPEDQSTYCKAFKMQIVVQLCSTLPVLVQTGMTVTHTTQPFDT